MMDEPGSRPLFIINSGAYTHQELSAEFGLLPPAFLPVGHGRLYELQAAIIATLDCDRVLTLPESFEIPVADARRLEALRYEVLRTPDDLPLGAALLHVLGRMGFTARPLRILHGDTLLEGVDLTIQDVAAVAEGADGYRWGRVQTDAEGRVSRISGPSLVGSRRGGMRLCGYFAFESAAQFAARLTLARGDFFDALDAQAAAGKLSGIRPARWLDFGHVQTFFRSRHIVTTARAFNQLEVEDMHVRKRSATATAKLRAEARWLRHAPPSMAPFCARVLEEGEDEKGYFYDTEYEYMPTLAELHVFGRLGEDAWVSVLSSCEKFVDASVRAAAEVQDGSGLLNRLAVEKTRERLERFAKDAGLDLEADNVLNGRAAPSLNSCLDDIEKTLIGCGTHASVMHGDFCFSNILYSFRTDRIRVIDPRAISSTGEFSQGGDVRYDLAKLMHSIAGRYDLILAGRFEGGRAGANAFDLRFAVDPWQLEMERLASTLSMGGVRLDSPVVRAVMTSLFLSMTPLHADRPDRQSAFIANALRLHLEGERATS